MKKTKDLTEGNLAKNFILFSIPLILSAILSQAYSTIDMIIAGRYIGDHALGAIGATSSFDILLTTLLAGFAVGFSVYVGRLFGEKNYRNMKIDIVNVLVFISAVIVATGVLCIVFCDLIFSLLNIWLNVPLRVIRFGFFGIVIFTRWQHSKRVMPRLM